MRSTRTTLTTLLGAVGLLCVARSAQAVNPLEYPDNGAGQFSRGGAWLATATDPIAVHYNPAALATQSTAFSVDARLNYPEICFTRVDENGDPATFSDPTGPLGAFVYKEQCNDREAFPVSIPAVALAWRVSDRLGLGIGLVRPSAYGTANEAWPSFATARNPETGEEREFPAAYRYMTLGLQSTIIFPTASIGYEVASGFRIGAGFISGIAVLNTFLAGMASANRDAAVDAAGNDSRSELRTQDLFMPGAILSLHWSVTDFLDVAAWGRWVDSVRTTSGNLRTRTNYYQSNLSALNPLCDAGGGSLATCRTAIDNNFDDDDFIKFEFPYPPPEVRVGIRFHKPRSGAVRVGVHETRDPLHDDIFDVELDASHTWNSSADEITVRFFETQQGIGREIEPVGSLPPIADRATGFKDSWGARLGGQYNVIQDKLGLMAGTWVETESQEPELLSVAPAPGPMRGGFGGGLVLRQDFIDFTFGYQFHWSSKLDNGGQGELRATAGVEQGSGTGFNVRHEPRDIPAVDRREFRSFHAINGGSITVNAHAFALGGVVRF